MTETPALSYTTSSAGRCLKEDFYPISPLRRWPNERSWPYEKDELAALARQCNEAEDAAKKVERQVEKSAAAMLLESRVGERFEAIVTGASDKGTWVRLPQPPVEGKLGSGFEGMDVGQKLRVKLVRTDVERGYIDFEWVR